MKKLLFFLLISTSMICSGQENPPALDSTLIEPEYDSIVEYVEFSGGSEALFPGGYSEMQRYIMNNMNWDCIQISDSLIESSKVYLSFLFKKDGSLTNIHVDKGVNPPNNSCFIEFIKAMPKWEPAKNEKGELVVQKVRLPITICLR